MADETGDDRPIDYFRLFPWLHLGRAFRMAVDPRKLLLAGLALLAITGMDAAYNKVFVSGAADEPQEVSEGKVKEQSAGELWREIYLADGELISVRWPWDVPVSMPLGFDVSTATENAARVLWQPYTTVYEPIELMFQPVGFVNKTYLVIRLLWALLVWGVVAGAITRMSALEFGRDERLGTGSAIRFAVARLTSFVMAPVIAGVCLGLLVLACFAGGLIGRVPFVGPLFAGLLWFLPLVAGFVMTLIVAGVLLGWPLMYATISTQDSDAFDGFSRSYTFVFGRPWYYALLFAVAFFLATVGIAIVHVFAVGTTSFAAQSVALGMSSENVAKLLGHASEGTAGTWPAVFWERFLLLLASGFAASFFWVASTIAYFLLRRADDGTALDEVEVELPEEAGGDNLAPLAGVAASSQPAEERPVVELSTEGDDSPAEGESDENPTS